MRIAALVAAAAAIPDTTIAFPAPGTRVRVTLDAPPATKIVGTLLATTDSTMTIADSTSSSTIVLASITALDVSDGRHGNAGRGTLCGFLAGAGAGLAAGAIVCSGCQEYQGTIILGSGLGGALIGAGIGALIGSGTYREQWQSVPLQGARVGVLPGGPGVRVAVSVGWPL